MPVKLIMYCKNILRSPLLICITIGLLSFSCYRAQDNDIIATKTTTLLANLISSEDPVEFSKKHNIELEDEMLKVVITVDNSLLSENFVSKYALRDYKKRKDIVTAYVGIDNLKELCNEPGVIFIRRPFKFRKQ